MAGDVLSAEYVEDKICNTFKKLFAWVVFWTALHYIQTGEMYDLWGNISASASGGGVLPVAWFLFTYGLLMLIGYPAWHVLKRKKFIFIGLSFAWIVMLAFDAGRSMINVRTQSLWLHLYIGYFCLGLSLSEIFMWLNKRIVKRNSMVLAVLIGAPASIVYISEVRGAEIYLPPHHYYGKWFYSVWLVCMFWAFSILTIKNGKAKKLLKRMADNTFVVYLGHLPILLNITAIRPLETTGMALFFIGGFFVGLELLAEVFKKMPLLRKLV